MYIKSMVIDGFKSYCQRTEIPGFDMQFNAITGLNGSGKSNILDAICFLLGISNLSHVRAVNLQELVYKSGQAGITKATVSIVFDNMEKSTSPYGYEQFDELTITRQVVVGCKNKYLINGTNATNTRVQDLFHSVQLNVNNPHFLIMQGRITKVLNMKPPEILSLLEEAASTKLYENKKEAALRTIEKKDSKLREIDRVLHEDITPTIRKLREERSSYLEYQKIVREIEHLSKLIVAYDFTCIEEAKKHTKNDLLKLECQLTNEKQKIEQLQTQKFDLEKQILNIADERDKLFGPALEEAEAAVSECQKAEAVSSGAAKRAMETLLSTQKHLCSLNTQCNEASSQMADKQQAAECAAGAEFKALEKDAEKAKEQLTQAQSDLEATTSGFGFGGHQASLGEQARVAEGKRLELETELKQHGMRESHLVSELNASEKELTKQGKHGTETAQELERQALIKKVEQFNKKLEQFTADDEAAGGDEASMTETYNRLSRELRILQGKNEDLSRQFHQLAVDFADPAPNFDRRRVFGIVAKLFDLTDQKYASAIEVAAGGKLYNLVVENDKIAKSILEHGQLRRRITMLPLNQIRGTIIPDAVVKKAQQLVGSENVAPAISLIRYPPHLQSVMEFVFGGMFVCSSLEIARKVAFHPGIERRTVTYEGDVFDPQGTLSGGSRGSATSSLLARLAEWKQVEKMVSEALNNLETAKRAKESASERAARRNEVVDKLDGVRHQLGILETQMRQSDLHRLRSDLERLKAQLALYNGVRHQLGILKTQMRQSNLHRLRSDLKRLKAQLALYNGVRNQLGILETQMRQSDLHRLRFDLERLKAQLDEVRKAKLAGQKRLSEATKLAEEAQWKINHAQEEQEKQRKAAEDSVEVARKWVDQAASALKDKLTLKEILALESEELKKELEQIKQGIEQTQKDIVAAEKALKERKVEQEVAKKALMEAREAMKVQQQLHDDAAKAMQEAKTRADQIKESISIANCAIDRFTNELEVQAKESKETGKRLAHIMESNPWIGDEKQFFGVPNGAFDFAKWDPEDARKRVTNLTERREKLSRTVNMRAMNMLGTAEEQYADLLRRQEIVNQDKRKIQAVIDDLDTRKEQVLQIAYEKVNMEFNNIFSSLLPGTRAQLVPPEGQTILDGLQFRVAFGDTWKESLSELSGGQRSLVALALILALLLFKPAPIYILDEVDAALDLSHTQNIGQLIKNHFKHSQFIVVSLKDGMFNNANVLFKTKFVDGVSTVSRHTPTASSKMTSQLISGNQSRSTADSRPHQITGGRRKLAA